MSSLFDHGLIRTAAVEQVVAPIASHLCHLVLLCDSAEEAEQLSRLEDAAQAVARATGNMAAAASSVVAAADQVLESLSELGSASDIKSLLQSFRVFSEALLFLNNLTVDRANALQDPRQAKQLLDSLDTLRRCISMLHTAMCTTIKHPTSEQAQQAKRYILDKVHSTVRNIIITLKSQCHSGSLGPCGYYTERRNSLLQLLTHPTSSIRGSGFDSAVRDLVFHCMVVANSSRREFQQRVVGHCRHILQFWSDIKRILMSTEDDLESLESTCTLLVQQIQMLDKALMTAVLYQVLDTFLTTSATVEELLSVTRQILVARSSIEMDLSFIQPQIIQCKLLKRFTRRVRNGKRKRRVSFRMLSVM
uniref:Uncharacterized protein n=1 Tax=Cyclopterus lumpus TaxID=8103 RepID=A0A8C2X850_CYCLU